MPVYKQSRATFPNPAIRFFYAHIPRTAGRFLRSNFLQNGFEWETTAIAIDFDSFDKKEAEGIELHHLNRAEYEKYYNVQGIPHIAIVRNPIDRFMACTMFLKEMYGDCQELAEDPMMFSTMIQNFPIPSSKNWFCPQMDFISSETNLWKFEDGFGKDFEEWFEEVIGTPITLNSKVKTNDLVIDETQRLEETPKLVDNARMLYQKDIEFLYPELK